MKVIDEQQTMKNIRAARKKAGLTQLQLGEKMFVAVRCAWHWENKNIPTIRQIVEIGQILGVPYHELIALKECKLE